MCRIAWVMPPLHTVHCNWTHKLAPILSNKSKKISICCKEKRKRIAFAFFRLCTVTHKERNGTLKIWNGHRDLLRRWQVILKEVRPSQLGPIWLSTTHTHIHTHLQSADPWLKVAHKQAARCSDPDLLQLMVSTLRGPVDKLRWQEASLLLRRQLSIFFFLHHPPPVSSHQSSLHKHEEKKSECARHGGRLFGSSRAARRRDEVCGCEGAYRSKNRIRESQAKTFQLAEM